MRFLATLPALAITAAIAGAQQPDFQWSKAEPAGTVVYVHNINGDVSVLPGSGTTVQVTARRHDGDDDNGGIYTVVKEYSGRVVVCVLWKNSDESCDEDGAHMHTRNRGWRNRGSMDVTVHLPASMMANASSVSGDIRMDGVHGDVRAGTVSGDLHLLNLDATSIKATSVSGDVEATVSRLSGDGALVFTSVSGDVSVSMPAGLNADFEMSTVSGELNTDFPLTLNGRLGRRSIQARIGSGGRTFKVSTVSGDVRLRAIR